MKSSVRNWIAMGIVFTVIYLAVTGKIDPDKILALATLIVGYIFGEKAALKQPGGTKGT